jgi:hypothetical protein
MDDDGSWFVNIKEHCEDGERGLYVKDLTIAHVRRWSWRFIDEFCWERIGLPGRYYGRFKNGWEPVFHFSIAQASSLRFNPSAVSKPSDSVPVYSKETNLNPVGSLTGIYVDREQSQEKGKARKSVAGMALPSNRVPPFSTDGLEHSAAFPIGLPRFFVLAFTNDGDAVYDPFMGSGSTMMAADQTGRRAYGCEISPRYCDVIATRYMAKTGGAVTVEREGQRLAFPRPA